MDRYSFRILIGTCVFALAGLFAVSAGSARAALRSAPIANEQGANTAAKPSAPRQTSLPAALRLAFYRSLARDAGAAYAVNAKGCAVLPKREFTACFDEGEVRFSGANTLLALHLVSYGREHGLAPVKPTKPTIENNRVSYVHGNLTEWWQVLPVGFEQGFTVAKRPGGHGQLVLKISTNRSGEFNGKEVAWGKLRYGGLVVTDADDKRVPAVLKSRRNQIVIAVDDTNAVYPLVIDPLVWLEQKVVPSGAQSKGLFGYSVDISGETALIGAPLATVNGIPGQGAAYVFTETGGHWHETQKLTANDGATNDDFGYSVALDGTTALVGAYNKGIDGNLGQGAVYVFSESNGSWSQTQRLAESDGVEFDYFGIAVALDGRLALITSGGAVEFSGSDSHTTPCTVHVFTRSNGSWHQTQEIDSPNPPGDAFGYSMTISGTTDTALIGAMLADVEGNDGSGAAYIFKETNGIWTQIQKLTASDGTAGDLFATVVSLQGNTALIGAEVANKAYIFTQAENGWTQTQILSGSSSFGSCVALDGNTALVGALHSNANQGSVHVFSKSGDHWLESQQLVPSDGTPSDLFGFDCALSGSNAFVGAHGSADFVGAAYFYGEGNLGLTVSTPEKVRQGQQYVSQTIATNNASMASPAVAATMTVPASVSFVSAQATQGSCNEASGVVTCDFGQIGNNAGMAMANVTFKVMAAEGEAINNTASVANATPSLRTNAITRINVSPIAYGGILETHRDKAVSGMLKASDGDGDSLTFSIVTFPIHGHVAIDNIHEGYYTYTPATGYTTGDSFTFKVNDGYDDSNIATMIVNVVNQSPVAEDGSLTANQNAFANGALQASDPDDDPLSFSIVTPVGHGSIKLDAETGDYTYTPTSDYFGADSFSFKVNDGQSYSNVATVSITVQGSAPPPPPPPSNSSGGGSFGGLFLMLLTALIATTTLLRSIRWKQNSSSKQLVRKNERKGEVMEKQGTAGMQIHGKCAMTVVGALVVLAATWLIPLSAMAHNASAVRQSVATQPQRSGLTRHGIESARKSGLPSHSVTMAPQSSLKLLAHAINLGPHAQDSTIGLTVALKLRHKAKLKGFLEQVQNPYSAVYHQWLTPTKFTALYGPRKVDVAQVVAFLKAHGITVKDVSSNRVLIHTEATTAVYERAFGVRINDYKLDGRRFYSTTDSPRLPRMLAPMVANILGLNHGLQMRPVSLHSRPLMSPHGLSPRQMPPASLTNLSPLQIAHAYNYPDITDVNNGAGVQVAILTAQSSGLEGLSDPHDFWAAFGLPDHTINVIPVNGDNGSTVGMGETLLDIEYSGAMGPGITQNVYVVAGASFDDFADMYNRFVNDTNPDGSAKNQVMTTSWGAPEQPAFGEFYATTEQIFAQAAAEGISMFAAAGDHGSGDGTGQDNVADYPSSSLYIASANGTQLNISNLAGDYGSEIVWNDANCFGSGSWVTGGAVSQLFDKPDWQTGPGVPTDIDMRMNSDMAATASCTKPMLLIQNGQWVVTGGTSAVAPQFAGMFAIAVAEQGSPLGQSNELIYSDANINYITDFHDVTEGNNGAFEAGSDWDHPTGWGSPDVKNLLSHIGIQGPKGTLKGTVTDAATGDPIDGARVTMETGDGTDYSVMTINDGTYSRALPAGDFTVSVSAFGYADGTASVSIDDGQSTTQNFTLNVASQVTLSGKVTDGSGHGYGLYADIKVFSADFGQIADVWTDPKTGKYSVKLPKDTDYTLNVVAAFNGYNTASKAVTLSGDKTQNFPLTVTTTCTAPGYRFTNGGFSEDFNGATFPPVGWTVVPAASTVTWVSSSQDPFFNGNYTGGTGDAAMANTINHINLASPFDTSLVTPPISVTSSAGVVVLKYKADFGVFTATTNRFDLDISADGGETWTTIKRWTTSHQGQPQNTGVNVQAGLTSYLPASGNFQLRWHYYDPIETIGLFAQIDDVVIGNCAPLPGGLITGQVIDASTGDGIVGAKVVDDLGEGATTIVNSVDPDLPVGSYLFFATHGNRVLTATHGKYTPVTARIVLAENQVIQQNLALKAARFEANPNHFTLHVMANTLATAAFALENTGSGNGSFRIWPINGPLPASVQATGPFAATPHYASNKDLSTPTATGKVVRRLRSAQHIHYSVPHVAGDPVFNFPAGISIYGLGVDHDAGDLWLGSISFGGSGGDDLNHRFLFDGTNTGGIMDVRNSNVLYMADMAFDDRTGTIWQLSVDGPAGVTSHIIEFDPATMTLTGNSVLIPSPQSERGLAYDSMSNTWYAGDFNSQTIYHFNAFGRLLDSVNVGLNITGLAYNSATGDLFVLTSKGEYAIYVLDAKRGYALVKSFNIGGFNQAYSGSGMGYDCNGNLWITDLDNNVVWQVDSGENGWCAAEEKGIPWLALAPEEGTVKAGTTTKVRLTFNGAGQKKFTSSQAWLLVTGFTPYPSPTIPLTVIWDPQPVNLSLVGKVSPSSPRKGNTLLYTLTVSNSHADRHGAATQVKLTYLLPQGVSYVAASGDAACTAPPSVGSSAVPAAASGGSPSNIVACDFGTIALGDSKTETLAVEALAVGKLSSMFKVNAREPDSDSADNSLSLASDVIGTADLALSADKVSIPLGGTGSIVLTLDNAGPDPAAGVQIHAKAESGTVHLQSASTSQGQCSVSGGALACDLDQVNAGKTVTVTLQLFGTSAGSAMINAQASTISDETAIDNNGVEAQVAVTEPASPDNGGGGSGVLGWFALVALLGLMVSVVIARRRRA